jgi:hypothetical protein
MIFSAVPPEDAVNKTIPDHSPLWKEFLSKGKLVARTGNVTIADLIAAALNGIVDTYRHNRGGNNGIGVVNKVTVENVSNDLNLYALGQCTMCLTPYEHVNPINQVILADFHSRLQGLLVRWWSGTMTKKELNFELSLAIVPKEEFISVYTKLNAAQKHGSRARILNPDLAYGCLVQRLMKKLGPSAVGAFQGKFLSMLSCILWAMTRFDRYDTRSYLSVEKNAWIGYDVYSLRTESTAYQNKPAGTITVEEKDLDDLAVAIDSWFEYSRNVRALGKKMPDISKIVNSSGWFGIFVVDKLAAEPSLPDRINVIANRTISNIVTMATECPDALHGSYKDQVRRYNLIMKLLCNRSKSKMIV